MSVWGEESYAWGVVQKDHPRDVEMSLRGHHIVDWMGCGTTSSQTGG
jgi:hypothetical protein